MTVLSIVGQTTRSPLMCCLPAPWKRQSGGYLRRILLHGIFCSTDKLCDKLAAKCRIFGQMHERTHPDGSTWILAFLHGTRECVGTRSRIGRDFTGGLRFCSRFQDALFLSCASESRSHFVKQAKSSASAREPKAKNRRNDTYSLFSYEMLSITSHPERRA